MFCFYILSTGGQGGGGYTNYFQFSFGVVFRKRKYIRGIGSKRKYIEEVYLKEGKGSENKASLLVEKI